MVGYSFEEGLSLSSIPGNLYLCATIRRQAIPNNDSFSEMTVARDKVSCLIFGAPRNLQTNTLPTYTDLMKKYIQYRQDHKTPNGKYPLFLDISHKLEKHLTSECNARASDSKTQIVLQQTRHNSKGLRGKKDQPSY